MKKTLALTLVVVMLALLVAACGGTPETIVQTVEVEKTVVEEVTVVETVEVETEVTVVEISRLVLHCPAKAGRVTPPYKATPVFSVSVPSETLSTVSSTEAPSGTPTQLIVRFRCNPTSAASSSSPGVRQSY